MPFEMIRWPRAGRVIVAAVVILTCVFIGGSRSFGIDVPGAPGFDGTVDAKFTSQPNPVTKGHSVTFDASASTATGGFTCRFPKIERYEWNLDGVAGYEIEGKVVQKAWQDVGPKLVELRVVTDCQGSASDKDVVVVLLGEDTEAPETQITRAPRNPDSSRDATFEFRSPEDGVQFRCRLDAAAWSACSSPKSYGGLAEGVHVFEVEATDPAGNVDPSPAQHTWRVDFTPPDTRVDVGPPSLGNDRSAAFVFSANEPSSTFECKLDAGQWGYCSSPKQYNNLTPGEHFFQVRAVDEATNVDTTPASHRWTIDVTPPETMIDAAPPDYGPSRSAVFAFSSNEPGSTFDCRFDGSNWSPCASPTTYDGLADGTHSFDVRATDRATNVDTSPANRSFTVDTTPPDTVISGGPGSGPDANFSFYSAEGGGSFECRLDSGSWEPCSPPKNYPGIGIGD